MARLTKWFDINRPILVLCAALAAAIATDLVAGHPSALRYATEIPALLVLSVVFIWRLGHLGDGDEQETDGLDRHFREPGSNARVMRNDE